MPIEHLIIDGYSLLHRDETARKILGKNLALARRRLLEQLERNGAAIAGKITVVFDGRGAQNGTIIESRHIEVIFSDGSKTADSIIERFVCTHKNPSRIHVVTSDRMERETVEAAGATSMSCTEFLERLESGIGETRRQLKPKLGSFRPTIGDLLVGIQQQLKSRADH